MLTFLLIFLALATLGGISGFVLTSRRPAALPAPRVVLSPPAKALVREYNALPADSRPFDDIVSVVKGLDDKHAVDAEERDNHFNGKYFDLDPRLSSSGYDFTWKKTNSSYACNHRYQNSCRFGDYVALHKTIAKVAEAVKEKERTILHSAHDTDTLAELETRLRQEAELQNTFTQEFKALS